MLLIALGIASASEFLGEGGTDFRRVCKEWLFKIVLRHPPEHKALFQYSSLTMLRLMSGTSEQRSIVKQLSMYLCSKSSLKSSG